MRNRVVARAAVFAAVLASMLVSIPVQAANSVPSSNASGRRVVPPTKSGGPNGAAPAIADITYHNGPVMHTTTTYAIYWQPNNPNPNVVPFSANYMSLINRFF